MSVPGFLPSVRTEIQQWNQNRYGLTLRPAWLIRFEQMGFIPVHQTACECDVCASNRG